MKLLTWMHRKLRKSNSDILKENPLGHPLLDNHQLYQKLNNSGGTLRQLNKDSHVRKSFASLEAERLEDFEEHSSAEFSELFHGFLAIGTLGVDTAISEPKTPTFTISIENKAEKDTKVTENELQLVNEELEKVLVADTKDDSWTDSSGRNSHVSIGRSSHDSTITLGGKPMELADSNAAGNADCPLLGYLFGSAVELPEKTTATKEHRASLGELLWRQKAKEKSEAKGERGDKRTDKERNKNGMNIMKKILKRKIIHASSKSSSAANKEGTEAASMETKLHKMLHIFYKKVHPERSISVQQLDKPHKIGIKNIIPSHVGNNNVGQTTPDEDITMLPQEAIRKRCMQHSKSCCNPPQFIVRPNDTNGNRGCWIKTDADYFVLEL
ncbi:hypothetical protein Nepgr_004102 [Nepenthes gracilis]|uniref:Protein LAZY 1 n=1 Tax=Nepenthes gracilis TaxID=150966 RepID=A0AAD3XEP1_NEPGR|nr:hypothetical protein Nepgr_004102 [Nepenthes gracilis]